MDWDDAKKLVGIMMYRLRTGDYEGVERQFTSIYRFGNENAAGKARLVLIIQSLIDSSQNEGGTARYLLERAEAYTDDYATARGQLRDPSCVIDRTTGLVRYMTEDMKSEKSEKSEKPERHSVWVGPYQGSEGQGFLSVRCDACGVGVGPLTLREARTWQSGHDAALEAEGREGGDTGHGSWGEVRSRMNASSHVRVGGVGYYNLSNPSNC